MHGADGYNSVNLVSRCPLGSYLLERTMVKASGHGVRNRLDVDA